MRFTNLIPKCSYRKLSERLCGLVEDYGLVRYVPLAIQDRESLEHVLGLSDKANGYVFARLANDNPVVPPPELMYGTSAKVWILATDKLICNQSLCQSLGGQALSSFSSSCSWCQCMNAGI